MLAAGRPLMKDYNVTMEVFAQEPDDYAQDQRLLEEILNLTAYQALGAITRPLHEGVLSLGQRGTMNEKHTITPLSGGKTNGVLTQVLTEARREAEERLRGTQEMKFTISTDIEEVLFKGRVRVNEMRLNDFLTRELDGRGVVDTNRDVLPEEFFKDPTKYIRDKGALNEMQASGHYLGVKRAVKGEVIFDEDIRKLCDRGVNNLPGRSLAAAEVKQLLITPLNISWTRLPRRRGTQRRRAHRRNWRDCTSLCAMRGGAMRWNFRTAWSERKRGREWGCMRGSQNSHGRTGKLTTLLKRMTLCSNAVRHLPC
ncbi:putative retrotransposon hot spot protein (RHS) [Trypanosoma cruzi]|uniref:Putative retrotransposon hot spot protein (RHS) n=1 Tax=Trypanosoma cruzi TaxID=5693 RepID=A0A2V2V1R0_TRYCR|nr:putative retrotransposon hot spot protein (RHS) [Trypanosoma cruzi]